MTATPNKTNSLQLIYTRPTPIYKGVKASIEALAGMTGGEEAYATNTGEWGHYDDVNAEWVWHGTGGGGGTWGSITGDLEDQEDLSLVLNRIENEQKNHVARIKKSTVSSKIFSNSNFI